MHLSLTVNGAQVEAEVAPNTLLVSFLREQLRLTGTHVGCDTSQCGACVVLLDGMSVKACTLLAVQADGRRVRTIEGVAAEDGNLHPLQRAFREHHAVQCGFCTPGMVLSALDLLSRGRPEENEVRAWLEGNFCRCTGYEGIVRAILAVAAEERAGADVKR